MKPQVLADDKLGWAVAQASGTPVEIYCGRLWCKNEWAGPETVRFCPSFSWQQGGPLIEEAGIHLRKSGCEWQADWWDEKVSDFRCFYGPTMLIAGLRAYVFSKLGADIDIPKELQ